MNLNKFRQISMNFKGQRPFGFTLLELMIVMGLIFFLTGTFVLTLRRSGNTNQLRDAAQELQSDLRGIKNDVMSGKSTSGVTYKAFSVKLDRVNFPNYYETISYLYPETDADGDVEDTIDLPSGVRIETIKVIEPGPIEINKDKIVVIYNNPFGKVFITDSEPQWKPQLPDGSYEPTDAVTQNCITATITLKNTNNFTIDITVDCESGSVDVGNVQAP